MPQHRTPIAPGIWRQGDRLVAVARIGSSRDRQPRERKTFPLGYSLEKIKAWQLGAKKDLILGSPAPESGTFAAAVELFLTKLPDVGRYKSDARSLLAAWTTVLGATPLESITRDDVDDQLTAWENAGVAVSTRNRRLSRLRKLFHKLWTEEIPNPTDKIKFAREPEPEQRDFPIAIARLILDALPDMGRAERGGTRPRVNHTKIRLTAMLYTGIPPATLRRVQPRHLDLDNARVFLTPRRKGTGTPGKWIGLLPEGVDALRAFVAAGLVGKPWNRSSVRKSWLRAIARAKVTAARTGDASRIRELANLPPHCRPYDLRHAFAAQVYRDSGDIRAVSELLQHADMETTKRYTKGAVSDRVTAALGKAAASFATPTPPAASAAKAKRGRVLQIVRKRQAS